MPLSSNDMNVIMDQPLVGSKEMYSWLTNIIESQDGHEYRIALRSLPRIRYEYSILAHEHNRNRYLDSLRNHYADE